MDKAVIKALQFNLVLDLIEPTGESGKHFKRHLTGYLPGQEATLRKEYQHLEQLIAAISSEKKLSAQLSSILAEIPYLPQTLKAVTERPLFLHECFELKKLVHYALQLKQFCSSHNLNKSYPFPDLDILYAMLDPDRTNSPAFALSPAFDFKLAKTIEKLQELQLTKRQIEHQLLKDAQKALGLNKPSPEIVISRLQTKELIKLQKSTYYYPADENFANLTFRLKDTPPLASLKKEITALTAKLTKVEEEVLLKLSKKLKTYSSTLKQTAFLVEQLDWDYARAVFAFKYNCSIPVITTKLKLSAQQAVNLPLKLSLASQNRKYQPLDLRFRSSLNILTGPNMGGKTTALKTVGQLVLMTRFAIPVPAQEAELCLFDNIWYNQELEGGENLSSFGKEIVSLAAVLTQKGKTLFLFDELAKGTNPVEGEAILTSVLEYLQSMPCLCLTATHYDIAKNIRSAVQYAIKGIDLTSLKKLSKADKNSLDAQLDLLNKLMDYSLVKLTGKAAPPQNAIPIAKILGLPEEIIRIAEDLTNKKG